MKCQRLFITTLCALVLTTSPMIASACDHSSQQGTGGSSSASSDSNGSTGSASSGSRGDTNGGQASQATQNSDANGPSNYQLIRCDNPIFKNFVPCFEQMVKEREAYVSQPKEN